ncbi:MAG: amidohydrolase family protein [Novosphingobium sp.]|nr:amidohydrolase family protein [Novosphingobium sp.]
MLIRNAEVWGHGLADLRIADGRIAAIGDADASPGETAIDANGGLLLPGLHDHHIHLAGLAARRASVWCGPPQITSRDALAEALDQPGSGWIRGIGYHESVADGLPDARALDRLVADRPLRMQHRSGRMWLLNSAALDTLLAAAEPPPGLEREATGFTGRLFDEDVWLREALGSTPPDFSEISRELASFGIVGMTDMSPGNDPAMAAHFAAQMGSGALTQQLHLAGNLDLADGEPGPWHIGAAKLHLHEAALPEFENAVHFIRAAHDQSRAAAIHCVSEVELVFALAALEEVGTLRGDRIEHASVASPELVDRIAELGLWVCVQPHFVAERGDRYLVDVEQRHHGDLYRLRGLAEADIPLAGGSDAPFGSADPWAAMSAAMSRTTSEGRRITPNEALSAEAALALYLAAPDDLTSQRGIAIGEPADLCLLTRPWNEAKEDLGSIEVAATFVSGRLIHQRVDQTPA